MAGTISPPGSWATEAPIAWNRSAARPTVRYLRPLRSAALVIGFLNQPSGWVGIGIAKKLLMLTFMIWVCSSS